MVIDFEINCFLELIACSLVTTDLILHWKQFFFDQINQLLFAQHFEGANYHVNAGLLLLLLLQSMIYQDHIPLCKMYLTAVQLPLLTLSKWLSFLLLFRESSVVLVGFQLEGFFLITLNSHLIVLKRPRRQTGQSYYYLLLLIIASITGFKSPQTWNQ